MVSLVLFILKSNKSCVKVSFVWKYLFFFEGHIIFPHLDECYNLTLFLSDTILHVILLALR
jgi:hypothetical protein